MNRNGKMANFLCTRSMTLLVCKGHQIGNTYKSYRGLPRIRIPSIRLLAQFLVYMLLDMCASMHICAFGYGWGEVYTCIYICRFVCMFLCVLEKNTTGIRKEEKYLSSSWIRYRLLNIFSNISLDLYNNLVILFINF